MTTEDDDDDEEYEYEFDDGDDYEEEELLEKRDVIIDGDSGSGGSSGVDNLNQEEHKSNSKSPSSAVSTHVSIYAGAGIVPGSTVQGEFTETSQKLGVISSLFPPSPITLQSSNPTPNSAWSTAFIEELVRSGVTQFYICPGSRSTPLTAAIAKSTRMNVGVVHAMSVHDERSAAFRALGYGRRGYGPAAVITSSGTAVANLYPAVVEAAMDGVPLLVLTADRPYEARDTGANQAIDQVKAFPGSYIRWFRDVAPPSDDVPISAALSDANHAVMMTKQLMGPVHINIQFRENLAPDAGPIRNDNRIGSHTKFNAGRFTDVPKFHRWSNGGESWQKSFYHNAAAATTTNLQHNHHYAVREIASLLAHSKRGMIVVGNVRSSNTDNQHDYSSSTSISATIADFAETVGFPIFAGVQSGALRNFSPPDGGGPVIPFAEHVLKHPVVSKHIKPDFILQIGTPLLSTEIPGIISNSIRNVPNSHHVLLHNHHPSERADPDYTVTHRVSSTDPGTFLIAVLEELKTMGLLDENGQNGIISSELCPLMLLGKSLQEKMPNIIHKASENVVQRIGSTQSSSTVTTPSLELTEPQVVLAMTEVMSELQTSLSAPMSLFLSNSMPVRDAEFFLYPLGNENADGRGEKRHSPDSVAVNRGASGIDGVISSASGYADSTGAPTTLLIGDVAALHDLNAFQSFARSGGSSPSSLYSSSQHSTNTVPLTTVIINNDGGGIFSFLPIARHGSDVGFEDYFGTPTNSFSFAHGAKAFGLPFSHSSSFEDFKKSYKNALLQGGANIIEAEVVGREANVAVHKEITKLVVETLDEFLSPKSSGGKDQSGTVQSSSLPSLNISNQKLPIKTYQRVADVQAPPPSSEKGPSDKENKGISEQRKTLVLLHGWMGDKTEWDEVGYELIRSLDTEWNIVSIDLPGHGDSPLTLSEPHNAIRSALNLEMIGNVKTQSKTMKRNSFSVDMIAKNVLQSLSIDHGIEKIDAICGYSLGGRVALAMQRLCSPSYDGQSQKRDMASSRLLDENTAMILLGSYPGELPSTDSGTDKSTLPLSLERARRSRMRKDDSLSRKMMAVCNRLYVTKSSLSQNSIQWASFLTRWYGVKPLWGNLQESNRSDYEEMITRRTNALCSRGQEISAVLSAASPARSSQSDWRAVAPDKTLFIAGQLDEKYSVIGEKWKAAAVGMQYFEIPQAGHGLLVEASSQVAEAISDFLLGKLSPSHTGPEKDFTASGVARELPQTSNAAIASSAEQYKAKTAQRNISQSQPRIIVKPGVLDYDMFSLDMVSEGGKKRGVFGIGWGDNSFNSGSSVKQRQGYIISLVSGDGAAVGIGEVSPLSGLHKETLDDAEMQLCTIRDWLASSAIEDIPELDAAAVFSFDGALTGYIDTLYAAVGVSSPLLPSVRSGLEMSIILLASNACRLPLPRAIPKYAQEVSSIRGMLPVNGLILRGESLNISKERVYPSIKVKLGGQTAKGDALSLLQTQQSGGRYISKETKGKVRGDANRAWDEESAMLFAKSLEDVGADLTKIEFVEEPLKQQIDANGEWSMNAQVSRLEHFYAETGIKYALDESLADLVTLHDYNFDGIASSLRTSLGDQTGCAAFVLKPALLGPELSMRLARLAHNEFGIGAVFSSSFDSGVGLAHTAILAAVSDSSQAKKDPSLYAHGVGTFSMLSGDTLSPQFGSYVNENGMINIPSLARSLYGLSIDEMKESSIMEDSEDFAPDDDNDDDKVLLSDGIESYQASTSTSSTGRGISVQVSLPLPFSDDIACTRFTDLPQQSRWSPWLNSVAYLDGEGETEWTLNVRGVEFSWRAVSKILDEPKGIMWESISGIKNKGRVEFIPTSEESCLMKVKMNIITPRILASLFKNTSVLLGDFLQKKLLKWSLEMFRDVVKADLALERGDVELGDALFGAVEGRANAIEATLSD